MRHIHLFVAGMSCRRCVREVTGLVRDVPGVETVSANAQDCTVQLWGSMQLADVLAAFTPTTYRPRLHATTGGTTGGPADETGGDDRDETATGKPSP